MAIEQLLILIKPDGIKKSLTGNILTKLSEVRMVIIGAKVLKVSEALAEEHYYQLRDKLFFSELVDYIQGKIYGEPWNRVLALVYQGEDAISKMRKIAGATNPEEADPVSIRGAYGRITTHGIYENVIHCSSDPSEAKREIELWFEPEEIVKSIYPTKKVVLEKEEKTIWA
ncbi:nucleoside diphosphate kinase [Endomicrobiia bacterium]|nr:nucleoside diphosphate kinase [Endomicrobiia bacterium]GHT47334.1 nucleoside diphosphate kinase [Endomicrobiia bacterium]